jgi:uncharacterized protein (DUF2062 family)
MSEEEKKLQALRSERIARTKKWLRILPRRSNIHRYPVLKWFSSAARKRSFLWSFRVQEVVPALYAGLILAFLPLYGIQVLLAFLLALLFRANLPVLVGLQFITNPLTVIPIYFTAFQIGRLSLNLIGMESPNLSMGEARALFLGMQEGHWGANFRYFATVIAITSFGSTMMGIFVASISSVVYRSMAKNITISYQRLRLLRHHRESEADEDLNSPPTTEPAEPQSTQIHDEKP